MSNEQFIEDCVKGEELSHEAFVKKYAEYRNMDEESANAVIWTASLFKKYSDLLRKKNGSAKNICEDCACEAGDENEIKKYYCGEFGCGKGSWCRLSKNI